MQLGGNDLFPAKPETLTTDILSYFQYLKNGIGIRNVVIGQLFGRLTLASSFNVHVDVVIAKRHLKAEMEKR